MNKIGKPFRRDVEFTGSCDVNLRTSSRLLQRLQSRGLDVRRLSQQSNIMRMSNVRRADVRGYMDEIEEKSTTVSLNADQKKAITEIYGWTPDSLEISLCDAEKTKEIALTADQQKTIAEALDIEMESLEMSRDLIEVTPR